MSADTETATTPKGRARLEPPDLSERGGLKGGVPQRSDRRLFMQLLAFGECRDVQKVIGHVSAEAMAGDALTAAADDMTLQQGEALVLDASKSVGDIQDYKWTIVQAPSGATAVVGQVIGEGSSGNLSLNPDDYSKYFPAAGDYTIRLTVMDTKGSASNDDFTISVP